MINDYITCKNGCHAHIRQKLFKIFISGTKGSKTMDLGVYKCNIADVCAISGPRLHLVYGKVKGALIWYGKLT